MKKLANTSKKIDLAAKILFWFLAIGGAAMTVICAVIAVIADRLPVSGYSFKLGAATFDLAGEYAPAAWFTRIHFAFGALVIAVAAFCTCLGIYYIRQILQPMKNERPFDGTVHKNLRRLAWLTLIGGAVISVLEAVSSMLIISAYDLQAIFSSEAITGMDIMFETDITFIIAFFLLYLLSYVFSYGEELQIQSDETL